MEWRPKKAKEPKESPATRGRRSAGRTGEPSVQPPTVPPPVGPDVYRVVTSPGTDRASGLFRGWCPERLPEVIRRIGIEP